MRHTDNNNLCVANIFWQDTNTVQYRNRTYIITVEPAIQECNSSCVTASQSIELTLSTGTEYIVTVVTDVCNGMVKSAKSKPLSILSNGMMLFQ